MQEVALVLVRVQALEQLAAAIAVTTPHVMAGGDEVGAEHQGIIEERLELDFPVAEDVRIGRAARLVFGEEVLEHVVPVLGGKIGGVQLDADAVAHGLGVGQVFLGGAVLRAVVLFPVLHEQAFDLIALFEQQEGGNRRVHAAGHADDHACFFRSGEGRNRHRSTPGLCKGANSISWRRRDEVVISCESRQADAVARPGSRRCSAEPARCASVRAAGPALRGSTSEPQRCHRRVGAAHRDARPWRQSTRADR